MPREVRVSPSVKFFLVHFIWLSSGFVLVIGLGLLLLSSRPGHPASSAEIAHSFEHEVGTALIVAAIISFVYEISARTMVERETISGVLSIVLGELVAKEVWETTRSQIFERSVMRRDAKLRLKLGPAGSTVNNLRELAIESSYDLLGLRSKARVREIRHELNYHLRQGDLPRFERVTVGDEIFRDRSLADHMVEGAFVVRRKVPKRGGESIYVHAARTELTNFPGSYYFVFSELTERVQIEFEDLPVGVVGKICPWPDGQPLPVDPSKPTVLDVLFLPGQSLEFRFEEAPPSQLDEADSAGRALAG